ncbi:hypothetical protein [Tumebacillus lipolyticus]|uniref:Uncharacterized protein n=1 Tax=Tumebacillus lipolyticus TaxID=1280370 RepID=A0ABW5A2E2_9BACL
MELKQTVDVLSSLLARHAESGGQIDVNVACVASATAQLAQIAVQQGKVCSCHVNAGSDKKETAGGSAVS